MHIHKQAFKSLKKSLTVLFTCILSNGEVIKYHKFISVVVMELSVRCLNTGPEDRLPPRLLILSKAVILLLFVYSLLLLCVGLIVLDPCFGALSSNAIIFAEEERTW